MRTQAAHLSRRTLTLLLAPLAILLLAAATYGDPTLYRDFNRHHAAGNGSSQCDLPVAQRTGGWTCEDN